MFFCARFLYKSYVLAAFSSQKSTVVQKTRKNVDEIDTSMRAHLRVCLRGPQPLAHSVAVPSYSIKFHML